MLAGAMRLHRGLVPVALDDHLGLWVVAHHEEIVLRVAGLVRAPVQEGKFYELYHGFPEVKPVTATTSKILYTLMMDESQKPDAAAKDADLARRRAQFEKGLEKMKAISEGK